MRMIYFSAKNFADIYTGLKRKSIEIDLSKSKNRIVLLIGPNGTGKTALLSKFHPFAYPGNMDIRNGPELILENEDGYKEVHFDYDGDIFVIKHYYMFKSGKGLKSFIAKNATELNPNGNVSSFKELVQMHLGLEQDLMLLLRLGSNVGSFLDKKATERKNFMSDILSEIDIYSRFYKKVNENTRTLKSLIKSIGDKITKLRIFDEKEEVHRMAQLTDELRELQTRRDEMINEIGRINGSINVLIPNTLEEFLSDMSMKEMEYAGHMTEIEHHQNKVAKLKLIMIGEIEDQIKHIEKEIQESENQSNLNANMIEFYFNQLNNLHTQREEKMGNLKYISSDLEYSRLNDLLLELHREKDSLDKKFKDYTPKCNREDLLTALSQLQEIDKFISDIQEYNETAVENVVTHYLKRENVESIVRREVTKIDDRIMKINTELLRMNEAMGINPDAIYILYKPEDSTCSCPYMKFYEDIQQAKEGSPREKLMDELSSLENKRERFASYTEIAKKIDFILMIIKTNKALIEKMPEDFFDINKILNSIKDYIPFYSEDHITNYIAVLEEYDAYQKFLRKIDDVHREKTFIEKNGSSIHSAQKELETLDSEIHKLEQQLEKLRTHNTNLEETLKDLNASLEKFLQAEEHIEKIRTYQDEAKAILDSLRDMSDIRKRVDSLLVVRATNEQSLSGINKQISSLEEEITSIRFRLMEFEQLSKERVELDEKFEEIELVKSSLSSTTGIPLLFIKLYLQNTKVIVNNLLDSVYTGELEIADYDITDKEFRIPYIKNGITVPDAAYCSQGERSFISLALSFALAEQSIEGYNIMLLDEIDATLDAKKRYEFIRILEKQLDTINSEQVFMITHNNMFDNYPVDVIITGAIDIENYKNINILFKAA